MKTTNIQKIYNNLFVVQLLLNLCNCIQNIASGYIAGNFLDDIAISCNSLISPLNMIVTSIAYIFSSSSEIICGKCLGTGDRKSLNKTFTHIVIMTIIAAMLFTTICFLMPESIVLLLGANSEILSPAITYLKSYSIGIFAYMLMPILITFLDIENEGNHVKLSVIVLAVSYAICGYLFAKPLNLSYFGLGLTTTISNVLALLFLIYKIIQNKKQIFFTRTEIDFDLIKRIFLLGLPSGYSGILLSIRNLVMNNVLIKTGGVLAISALSVSLSCITIQDAVITSALSTTMIVTSICCGEKNKDELLQLIRHIFTFIIPLNTIFVLIQLPLTNTIASIYSTDINIINLAGKAAKLYLLATIFEMCNDCLIAFYTAFENFKFINFFNVIHNIVLHLLFIFVTSSFLGYYSVFGSYLFTEVVCFLVYVIYSSIKKKKLPKSYYDLVIINNDLDAEKFYLSVKSYEQVVNISKQVTKYCLDNNISKRTSNLAGLCFEELATNIFEHGFTKKKVKDPKIDIFVIIENDDVSLRIRDNAIAFNPEERSTMFDPKDPCKNIGLRIARNIAKDFTYQNLFGLNNTIIKIQR